MDLENLQNGIKHSIRSERQDKSGQLWQNLPGLTGILCLRHRIFGLAKINNIVSLSWYHINRLNLKKKDPLKYYPFLSLIFLNTCSIYHNLQFHSEIHNLNEIQH